MEPRNCCKSLERAGGRFLVGGLATQERKRMGIEPTYETRNVPHNGFEDRGRHQAGTHLRMLFAKGQSDSRAFSQIM